MLTTIFTSISVGSWKVKACRNWITGGTNQNVAFYIEINVSGYFSEEYETEIFGVPLGFPELDQKPSLKHPNIR